MSENREETMNTLYIPVNIKTRFEFFSGFGFTELTVTALITACSIMILRLYHKPIDKRQ